MTTTTNVQQVKVNKVTQAQYDSMTKNDNEFYVIVDKEYLDGITSADVTAALGYTPISAVTSNMVTSALGFTPANASGVQTVQGIQPITSSTTTMSDAISMYSLTPSSSLNNLTFNYAGTNNKSYTFELMLNMSSVQQVTFNNVHWQDGKIPDLSTTGVYFLAFRKVGDSNIWYGNLQGKW